MCKIATRSSCAYQWVSYCDEQGLGVPDLPSPPKEQIVLPLQKPTEVHSPRDFASVPYAK